MDTNTYDSESGMDSETVGVIQRTWTDPGDSTAVTVAELVGTALDRDPVDLPPINDYVDADALDEVFGGAGRLDGTSRGMVEFEYADCRVRVYSDGEVVVDRGA